eukprot:CAMPEP_0184689000 /NCGR_PEP_ID=MMETSP0312-20130426/30406_1 /TAXON_ID=31354 /ORGANISM="Compsopogon coeruleus, Strain SAG 36.94" /LENGTH=399 /DNA_ID=CAMNT_0027146285 /DNA_START=160 /DNA_END=1359 /DNA_ORIENTATION=-
MTSTLSLLTQAESRRRHGPTRDEKDNERLERLRLVSGQNGAGAMREQYLEFISDGVKPTMRLYHGVLSQVSRSGRVMEAIEYFEDMKEFGLVPDSVTYDLVLLACQRASDRYFSFLVWSEMIRDNDLIPGLRSYAAMLNICALEEDLVGRARGIYEHMIARNTSPDSYVYAALIHCCRTRRDLVDGMKIFESMHISPDSTTYNAAIQMCAELGDMAGAEKLLAEMSERQVANNLSYGSLLAGYIMMAGAEKLLAEMSERQVANNLSYGSLLAGYIMNGDLTKLNDTIGRMKVANIDLHQRPLARGFRLLCLRPTCRVREARAALEIMEREFFVSGSLWCIVLEGYILHRLNFDEALMLYKTLRKRDLVLWNESFSCLVVSGASSSKAISCTGSTLTKVR